MGAKEIPTLVSLLQAKRVLFVQPHYDDTDIAAGGTVALLAAHGVAVDYFTVSDDLAGVVDPALGDQETLAIIRREQEAAGEILGVQRQIRLELPDAEEYAYHLVRTRIMAAIRERKPDYLFTCDPWLPYEAHRDHYHTGLAAAEAAIFYNLPRFKTDPQIDAAYTPYELSGVLFYFTHRPNLTVDIGAHRQAKHQALDQYRAQFTPADLAELHQSLTEEERRLGAQIGVEYGEAFKALLPDHLHIDTQAWKR